MRFFPENKKILVAPILIHSSNILKNHESSLFFIVEYEFWFSIIYEIKLGISIKSSFFKNHFLKK